MFGVLLALVAVIVAIAFGLTGGDESAESPEQSAPHTHRAGPGGSPYDEPTGTGQPEEEPNSAPSTSSPPGTTSEPTAYRVVVRRIVDGDTLVVTGHGPVLPPGAEVRVRLLEIDTPEVGTCYSEEATARTSELLPVGSSARIARDDDLRDQYGRYLVYMWNADDEFVNVSLVRTGHAVPYLVAPNDGHWPTVSSAGDVAEQQGAGLWSACANSPQPSDTPTRPTPSSPEPQPSGNPGLPAAPPPGGPDVDCSDLSGPVWVGPNDPYRLDRDGDGIGCDAN